MLRTVYDYISAQLDLAEPIHGGLGMSLEELVKRYGGPQSEHQILQRYKTYRFHYKGNFYSAHLLDGLVIAFSAFFLSPYSDTERDEILKASRGNSSWIRKPSLVESGQKDWIRRDGKAYAYLLSNDIFIGTQMFQEMGKYNAN